MQKGQGTVALVRRRRGKANRHASHRMEEQTRQRCRVPTMGDTPHSEQRDPGCSSRLSIGAWDGEES